MEKKQKNNQNRKNKIALKGGVYSLIVTGIVLAILIAVNVFVSILPSNMTKYDMSSTKLYSITSNTKAVVNSLKKDIKIYWVVQADKEDDVIENLLAKYESLSKHIKVVKKNPDVYPTFTEKYTSEEVPNNSLIVECGDKNRYISYEDIYVTQADATGYGQNASFDGEGAITSAIDYVVSEELPKIYLLEGHGEQELPETFRKQIERENMETESFSLLNEDSVPEDADVVLVYAPTSDISEKEQELLAEYVKNGGKMMVAAGPTEEGNLTNLYGLLAEYGVEPAEGIVVEEDREHFAFQQPYILLPDLQESSITNPLIEENYYAILPIAQGLRVKNQDGQVTELLTTSETAYSKKAGYDLETYEKEEGDEEGPFALAVSVDAGNDGQIVWFSSSLFLEDMYNSYSSGANLDMGMNALSSLVGEREAVSIRSKSLNYNYLTIDESTASLLKTVMIGVFPLAFVVTGIVVVVRRRRRNEKG